MAVGAGYIKLHRSLAEHPLWRRGRFTPGQAWVDLLLMANYHDSKIHKGNQWIEVRRGQVFTSQKELAPRWFWDRKTVRSFLDALKADMMLDIETSKRTDTGYTLLTIRNFEKYQGCAKSGLDIETDIEGDIRTDIDSPSIPHRLPTSKKVEKEKKESVGDTVAPAPASSTRRSGRHPMLVDQAFIASLKSNYAGIDVDREVGKCRAWLQTPRGAGKQLTRTRLVNWLNRCEPSVSTNGHVEAPDDPTPTVYACDTCGKFHRSTNGAVQRAIEETGTFPSCDGQPVEVGSS